MTPFDEREQAGRDFLALQAGSLAPTKIIYVVSFAPDFTNWHGDNARVGGFDWRPTWEEARDVLLEHLEQGNSGHDYVMRAVLVPRVYNRDEITAYLNGELHELLEVGIPREWYLPTGGQGSTP
jgi:hypothetical protein